MEKMTTVGESSSVQVVLPNPVQPPPYTAVAVQSQPGQPVNAATCVYRDRPVLIVCHLCGATATTTLTYKSGSFAFLLCAIICFLGLWMGCCLVPFVINDCRDVHHFCPNCNAQVGCYNRWIGDYQYTSKV